MLRQLLSRIYVSSVVAFVFFGAPALAAEDEIPESMWELRDKYTFDGPAADVGYAVDYGDWRVLTPTLGEVFSNVGWQVKLADGTVVKPRACGRASTTRDRATNAIGPGIVYLTQCPVKDGLKITHKMASYENRSGVTVHLEVENVGTAPIQIAALQPMMAEAGDITQVRMASDGDGGPYVFTNASERLAILLGMLPLGGAKTSLHFKDEGGAIAGGATAAFDPPLTLAPGERIETDPFMIVFAYDDPAKAREFFGYARQDVVGEAEAPPVSDATVAAAPTENHDAKDASEGKHRGRTRRSGR